MARIYDPFDIGNRQRAKLEGMSMVDSDGGVFYGYSHKWLVRPPSKAKTRIALSRRYAIRDKRGLKFAKN